MRRKPAGINRKTAILLALLIFFGSAAYLNVYDYLSFTSFSEKVDVQLTVLSELDKNVAEKKSYLSVLEETLQPRISVNTFQNFAKNIGLNFNKNQDGSYKVEGVCKPEDVQELLRVLLGNPNLRLKSLSIDNETEIPVLVPGLAYDPRVSLELEFWSVIDR